MDPDGQIMDLGTVAAANIARALDMDETKVPSIRQAISDEIGALSTHFTLAFSDISAANETAQNALREQNTRELAASQARNQISQAVLARHYMDAIERGRIAANRRAVLIVSSVFTLVAAAVGLVVYFTR